MATRLAHLRDADEAAIWSAVPAAFLEVMGLPCDQSDAYHVCIAAAVVEAVRRPSRKPLACPAANEKFKL